MKQRRKLICNCCGACFVPWEGYKAPDNESNECSHCRIDSLRRYVKLIEEAKELIYNSLNEVNRAKFRAMNSQRKKLLVFQLWETDLISWKINR